MSAAVRQDAHLDVRRAGRITGSRIGAVLGVNPYSKPADVIREMIRQHFGAPQEFSGNTMTRYGQEMEPVALAQYESERGVMTYGGGELLIHPEHGFLAVTADGLIGNDGMIEIKVPWIGRYTHWQEKPSYEMQMRLQMECAGRKWCDFAVLQRDGVLYVSRLHHDPNWLPCVLPTLREFMDQYAEALSAPECHMAGKDRDDQAWFVAAKSYLATCAELDALEKLKASERATLLSLAGDSSAKGAGVSVIRSERVGTVAYAAAIKALCQDADLAPFTGKPSVVFTIKAST